MTEQTTINQNEHVRYGQAILLYAVACVLMVTVGFGAQAISPRIGLAITLLFVLLLPALLFARWKRVPIREALRLRPVGPALMVTSLLAGIGGWGIAILLVILLDKFGLSAIAGGSLSVSSTAELFLVLIVGAVMPGICEEALFRGAIQGVLERRGKWFAILLSGVLFGLFHMDPVRIIAASLLGVFFGWLVVRTGSIVPAMLAHFANNATAISVGHFFKGDLGTQYWFLASLVVIWLVATFLLYRLTASHDFQNGITTPPLTHVPAGVPTGVAWGCGIPGVIAGLGVIAGMGFLQTLITTASVDDDVLAPRVKSGEQLILMKPSSPVFKLRPETIVVFKRGDQTLAREVSRIDDGRVWISDPLGDEVELDENDLIGSLIQPASSPTSSEE